MMEFVSGSARKVAGGSPDFTEHDRVKDALQSLCDAHGGCRAVEEALLQVLVPQEGTELQEALKGLLKRHGEGLVLSEMKLLNRKNVSTWAPIRQRSWGPYDAAGEIAAMRGQKVDIRA
jgi:hypothetical protein